MEVWYLSPPREDLSLPIGFVVSDSVGFCYGRDGWDIYYDRLVEWFFARGVLIYAAVQDGASACSGDYEELILGLLYHVRP